MLKLVDSGVPGLDSALGGGFYRPSTVLIMGDESSGKTTFALQSLIFACGNQEKALYVTPLREPMDVTLAYLERMGFYDKEVMDKGDFTVIDVAEVVNNPGADIVSMLQETVTTGKFDRVCFDDISLFSALLGPNYGPFLVNSISVLTKLGCMVYLVAAEPDSLLMSVADGILLLDVDAEGRSLQIVKMRGSDHRIEPLPVELSDIGIMVKPEMPHTKS